MLVTGANGMLGSAVIPALLDAGHEVLASDIVNHNLYHLDVRDPDAVLAYSSWFKPDLVAHLAAETSLEVCEDNPDHAWLTNALGTRNTAIACRKLGVPMAYISSAGVFDGEQDDPYTEFDVPAPINVYGASKYEGELFVQQWVPEHFIVRAGWMMGGGEGKDHKFVSHILHQLDAGSTLIHAVADKFGTPTYAPDFAKCFETLVTSERYGTYHMASPGKPSRLDVALAIVELLGYADEVTVRACSSSHFQAAFFAPRPTSECMRNYVLDLEGRNTMRPWREALADYLGAWS